MLLDGVTKLYDKLYNVLNKMLKLMCSQAQVLDDNAIDNTTAFVKRNVLQAFLSLKLFDRPEFSVIVNTLLKKSPKAYSRDISLSC